MRQESDNKRVRDLVCYIILMGVEFSRLVLPFSRQSEFSEQLPQAEFLTPFEFNQLVSKNVGVVSSTDVSAVDIKLGFKSVVYMLVDKWVVKDDGRLGMVPQFGIALGVHLTREQRGIAFLRDLDSVRLSLQANEKEKSITTFKAFEREAQIRNSSIEDYYSRYRDLVDAYIDGVIQ